MESGRIGDAAERWSDGDYGMDGCGKDYGFYSKGSLWVTQGCALVYVLETPLSTENGLATWKQGGVLRISVMLRKMVMAWSRVSAKW